MPRSRARPTGRRSTLYELRSASDRALALLFGAPKHAELLLGGSSKEEEKRKRFRAVASFQPRFMVS